LLLPTDVIFRANHVISDVATVQPVGAGAAAATFAFAVMLSLGSIESKTSLKTSIDVKPVMGTQTIFVRLTF